MISSKPRGFTLVELLIVIVVIGILAAISTVAYNGIQRRAYASAAAASVDGYIKLIEMYAIENGEYPDTGGGDVCLSPQGSLEAEGEFAADECNTNGVYVSAQFNASLQSFASQLPSGKLPAVEMDDHSNQMVRGVMYFGKPSGGSLIYFLNGDYDCPRGDKSSWREGTTNCEVIIGENPFNSESTVD